MPCPSIWIAGDQPPHGVPHHHPSGRTFETEEKIMITILAVDDNPDDLFFLKCAFGSSAGYRFMTAGDGIEAQERLRNIARGKDLAADSVVIFSDLNMPRQNGLEFLQSLKSEVRFRDLPVVMISSFDNQAEINKAFELGAVACMVKPPDPNATKGLLKTITGMREHNAGATA